MIGFTRLIITTKGQERLSMPQKLENAKTKKKVKKKVFLVCYFAKNKRIQRHIIMFITITISYT